MDSYPLFGNFWHWKKKKFYILFQSLDAVLENAQYYVINFFFSTCSKITKY